MSVDRRAAVYREQEPAHHIPRVLRHYRSNLFIMHSIKTKQVIPGFTCVHSLTNYIFRLSLS